jgi:hypothetical protein
MPRTIRALFEKIEDLNRSSATSTEEPRKYRVRVSYIQIYNEQVYDLLNGGQYAAAAKGSRVPGLRVRWTKDDDFYVENLFMSEVYTPDEVELVGVWGLLEACVTDVVSGVGAPACRNETQNYGCSQHERRFQSVSLYISTSC